MEEELKVPRYILHPTTISLQLLYLSPLTANLLRRGKRLKIDLYNS